MNIGHCPSSIDMAVQIPHSVPVSSKDWLNIDELLDALWKALDLVRV